MGKVSLEMTNTERQVYMDFRSLFASETGSRVIKNLSNYCYENRSTFVEGSPSKQNVNNGKRAVILYIREKMNRKLDEETQTQAIHKTV